MTLSANGPARQNEFSRLLRSWRHKRRVSQLDLALSSGVSQRHVSFLESGRSHPSRGMVVQLSEALDVPLRARNEWLSAAGFAPMFKERPLDDPQMGQIMRAVQMMLASHEPFPAIAIDRAWNIAMANTPFERMATLIDPLVWTRIGGKRRNLMRLFFRPDGLQPYVKNWDSIGPLIWQRANREAESLGGDEMKQVLAELKPHEPAATFDTSGAPLLPIMPFEIEKDGVQISLFTVIATFGTAQDVTTDELRIESLFPADQATEQIFRTLASATTLPPQEVSEAS